MALARVNEPSAHDVSDFIFKIGKAKSYYDLYALSLDVVGHYYFDFLCVLKAPGAENRLFDELALISNIPALPTRQDEKRLDAVMRRAFEHARQETGYLHMRLADPGRHGEAPDASGRLEDFGFGRTDAFFLSVHAATGHRGVVGFFGNRHWVDVEEVIEMNYLSGLIFDKACRLSVSQDRSRRLSKREYECLYWTAAGKTSVEIATILELSEHTINNYLAAACHKLDSVNRAHAVAKAIRQGIIA